MKYGKLFLFASLLFSLLMIWDCSNQTTPSTVYQPVLVIHGGAGNITPDQFPDSVQQRYHEGLIKALEAGFSVLESGGSSLDAVELAIRVLEEDPLFNAGIGSVLTSQGEVEMDASVMRGDSLLAGAVAGIKHFSHPISLARAVMEKTPHVLLMGTGAEEFALKQGFTPIDPTLLITPKRKQQWERSRQTSFHPGKTASYYGTVGAVALDKHGNLAAGTSTGGMMNKMPGRVGDSPIIGAGTYAKNTTCGLSATGHGEFFIKYSVCASISMLMEYRNYSLKEAGAYMIQSVLKPVGGNGGVIGLDRSGNILFEFNTSGMFRGYIRQNTGPRTFLFGMETDDIP